MVLCSMKLILVRLEYALRHCRTKSYGLSMRRTYESYMVTLILEKRNVLTNFWPEAATKSYLTGWSLIEMSWSFSAETPHTTRCRKRQYLSTKTVPVEQRCVFREQSTRNTRCLFSEELNCQISQLMIWATNHWLVQPMVKAFTICRLS